MALFFPPHLFGGTTLPWETVKSRIYPQTADFPNATTLGC